MVVEGQIGAQAAAEVEALGAAGRGRDPGSGRLGHLNHHRADSARPARYVDHVARS